MENQDKVKAPIPPYVTFKTFYNFTNGLRDHALPLQIDRSLMRNLSGSAQSSLLACLKSLKLVDLNNSPTQEFERLHASSAGSEEYKEALLAIIYKSYAFLADGSIDIERATGKQLEDKFKDLGVSGGTIVKAYAFFIAISKEAGLKVSNHITAKKPSAPRKSAGSKSKSAPKPKTSATMQNTATIPTSTPAGTFTFEVPIYGKATARISLPKDMTSSEWTLINTVINAQAAHLLSMGSTEE